jgi:hypothetical protein
MTVFLISLNFWNKQQPLRLYEAAAKVFALPPIEALWNKRALRKWRDSRWGINDHFGGPAVYFSASDIPCLIETETSSRQIYLSWATPVGEKILRNQEKGYYENRLSEVEIKFPGGSNIAAGELVAHLREMGVEGVQVVTEKGCLSLAAFEGPAHPSLGRFVFDPEFQLAHPEFWSLLGFQKGISTGEAGEVELGNIGYVAQVSAKIETGEIVVHPYRIGQTTSGDIVALVNSLMSQVSPVVSEAIEWAKGLADRVRENESRPKRLPRKPVIEEVGDEDVDQLLGESTLAKFSK